VTPLRRVLCVDDDEDILSVVSLALRSLGGLEVTVATGGAPALAILAREPIDLVLLDVMMPGMDGMETMRLMRENPATAGVPVVLMTARVQLYDSARRAFPGVHAVISKPFDPVALPGRLAAIWAQIHGA